MNAHCHTNTNGSGRSAALAWGVATVAGLATLWAVGQVPPRTDAAGPVPGPGGGLPIGSVIAYAGASGTVPEAAGWMLCDGRELPVGAFPALHAAIGVAWGGEPGGSTFRLPDLRGRFLRGANAGAEGPHRDRDASARFAAAPGGATGDQVGSLQADAVGTHHHALVGLGDATGPGYAGEWMRFFGYKVPDETAPVVTNLAAIQSLEATETRPVNLSVNWIIRVR